MTNLLTYTHLLAVCLKSGTHFIFTLWLVHCSAELRILYSSEGIARMMVRTCSTNESFREMQHCSRKTRNELTVWDSWTSAGR